MDTKLTPSFTHTHYRACIEFAKSLGFSFFTMHDYLQKKPEGKVIVLRHDVDLSLQHALNLAQVEHDLGVPSTYFIRVKGPFDISTEQSKEQLQKIHALGHEIALHYDSDIINLGDTGEVLAAQKDMLENCSGASIFGAALHKVKMLDKEGIEELQFSVPFLKDLGMEYDAYQDEFLKEMKYISDSSHQWREGDMSLHIPNHEKLCILTHPIWWSSTTSSLVSVIEELVDYQSAFDKK